MKNIVFDVGGVLVQWRPYDIAARLFDDDASRGNIVDNILCHDDWSELDRGDVTWDEIEPRFASRSGLTPQQVRRVMEIALESLELKHDSIALVTELKEKKVPLYCLSDMPQITYNRFRRQETFLDLFDGLVLSWQVRMTKREPGVFDYLLKTFSLNPAETVFIDDSERNLRMAESFGITTILFQNASACRLRLAELGFF